jgi:hypothetical protein
MADPAPSRADPAKTRADLFHSMADPADSRADLFPSRADLANSRAGDVDFRVRRAVLPGDAARAPGSAVLSGRGGFPATAAAARLRPSGEDGVPAAEGAPLRKTAKPKPAGVLLALVVRPSRLLLLGRTVEDAGGYRMPCRFISQRCETQNSIMSGHVSSMIATRFAGTDTDRCSSRDSFRSNTYNSATASAHPTYHAVNAYHMALS